MATNDYEEERPTRAQQLESIFGRARETVTGDPQLSVRVFVALMVVVAALAAPLGPWGDVVGLLAVVVIALSWPTHRR